MEARQVQSLRWHEGDEALDQRHRAQRQRGPSLRLPAVEARGQPRQPLLGDGPSRAISGITVDE
jgi:hypothetical protein